MSLDTTQSIDNCCRFLAEELARSGLNGYVVGLSGGIDSSLSAALAVKAVGSDKVLGVMMPYRTSSPSSLEDAQKVAEQLALEIRQVDISPMVDAYYTQITPDLQIRAGNKMARERMSILFDLAHKMTRLVLGTGNRTEICLGYTTIYGDSACSVNPIGELYKTEVRQLAKALELPDSVISKAPSADLWADQTDEGEIGVTYDEIDGILGRLVDDGVKSLKQLTADDFAESSIRRVVEMLNRNAFKRSLPPVATHGRRSIPRSIVLES